MSARDWLERTRDILEADAKKPHPEQRSGLTARLLAEIDKDLAKTWRDKGARRRMYTALRKIVQMHTGPHTCNDHCETLAAVADALGIEAE